jgi:hypothetical protein
MSRRCQPFGQPAPAGKPVLGYEGWVSPSDAAPADVSPPREGISPVDSPRREGRSRDSLLQARIKDLQLHLKSTPLEVMIQQLHGELEAKGLSLRPECYLSDQWGCPSEVPVIGIPFYLADPALHSIERELGGNLESEEECRMYLRHEAGHVFSYSYRLFDTEEWKKLFGDFHQLYREDYKVKPFSRKFVNHIPGWYSQKHPDEDFAETFAVWLDPTSNWQKRYAGWGALKKLQYVDAMVAKHGREAPLVTLGEPDLDVGDMETTVLDHYRQRELDEKVELQLGEQFDANLSEIFEAKGHAPAQAETFVRAERQSLIAAVGDLAGSMPVVRALVDHMAARTAELGLTMELDRGHEYMARLTALVTTLAMNHLYTNRFYEE